MRLTSGLAVRALWPIMDGLHTLGYDASTISTVLRDSGLDQLDLEDLDARVPHAAAIALWEHAVDTTGDPDLGLHIAQTAADPSFDLHAYLMGASATLGDAYRLMCRYQRLIHDATRVELRVNGDRATLRHVLPGGCPVPRQPAEFLLAIWLRTGRALIGRNWNPDQVHFAHPEPASTAELQRFFGAPLRFLAADNRLVFRAELLDEPSLRADSGMLAVLSRVADQVLSRLPRTDSWADRARTAAAEELRGGNPSVEQVSRQLRVSARTLQRRLAAEGTSYAEVLDRLRRDLAATYLADRRFSIAEATFFLGYSDLTSFHRAVKRWTGVTPAQWRAQIVAGK